MSRFNKASAFRGIETVYRMYSHSAAHSHLALAFLPWIQFQNDSDSRASRDVKKKQPLMGKERGHVEHCLSELRQHILCAADSSLEDGDSFARGVSTEGFNGFRQCADSEALYRTTAVNWGQWLEYSRGNDANATL